MGMKVVNRALAALGLRLRLTRVCDTGWMTNVEQRANLFHLASQALAYDVPGAFVELGCYTGQTAAMLRKIIDHYGGARQLHVYDSFDGLPEVTAEDGDTPFRRGQMATTRAVLMQTFETLGLAPPEIHAGWFEDTLPGALPDAIAFAHLDGDLFSSTKTGLEHVYPRLSKGAVCVVDDYADPSVWRGWNRLPGVKRACDEFLADKPEAVSVLYAGDYAHGYFRKL